MVGNVPATCPPPMSSPSNSMSQGNQVESCDWVSPNDDDIVPNESLHVKCMALREMPVQIRDCPRISLTPSPLLITSTEERQIRLWVYIDHEYSLTIMLGQ